MSLGTMQMTKPKTEKPATPKPQLHGYRYSTNSSTMGKGLQHSGFRWIPIECHNLPSPVLVFSREDRQLCIAPDDGFLGGLDRNIPQSLSLLLSSPPSHTCSLPTHAHTDRQTQYVPSLWNPLPRSTNSSHVNYCKYNEKNWPNL